MERTLVIFKPDCMEQRLVGTILSRFESAGLDIAGSKLMLLSKDVLLKHYEHIMCYPFFPKLLEFMRSRPVLVMALDGENAISKVRDLIGPTDSSTAPKGTIRGDFGENSMFNMMHASDSVESAQIELKRFFNETDFLK